MTIQERAPLGPRTTMRIGGTARYFAELHTREDVEQARAFALERKLPLIPLGAGANTIFADGEVNALVVRIAASTVSITKDAVTAEAGCVLASLLVQCAEAGRDLSALTGIPGTFGGAIIGNAGQGPKGIWLDSFVRTVTVFADGEWKTLTKEECGFAYRESVFKHWPVPADPDVALIPPIVWEATLDVPARPPPEIKAEIDRLMKKRLEAQPFRLTAGSCFKAVDGTPAWQLIDEAGLRGTRVGGVMLSEKHANFLINADKGTFADAVKLIDLVRKKVPKLQQIEMRLYGEDGHELPR